MSKPLERNSDRDLWDIPFSEILNEWDRLDDKGRDANARAALCLEDRYYLLINVLHAEYAWKNEWLYDRCREVERDPDGYIDIWARGHFKSTLITYAGIIQEVLKNREIVVGIFSHTFNVAKAFLSQIKKEFEINEDLKQLFPKVLYDNPAEESPLWSVDGGIIVRREGNPREATIEAHGLVDGMPTGKHFQLMVYDDVVTEKSVATEDQIKKTTEAWSLSDNLGTLNTRKWIIGTRYHYADTYATIIKKEAAKLRVHKATYDGTMDGELVLLTKEQWKDKLVHQLESDVACQLLCDPLSAKQRTFDPNDLETYEIRPLTLMVYLMVDPGRSIKQDSDHTAMVVLGIDKDGNKYLLDGIDHKIDLRDRWRWMRDLWEKWRAEPGVMGIHVGYEKYGAQSDMDYFKYQMQGERKLHPQVNFDIAELEWPRDGARSKIDRIQRLSPDLKDHKLFLPYPTHSERLTREQRRMVEEGFKYRIARPIRQLDENGQKYDLTENLRMQFSMFPFGGRVDLLDALSRFYDMDPVTPQIYDQESLEPDVV